MRPRIRVTTTEEREREKKGQIYDKWEEKNKKTKQRTDKTQKIKK